MKLLYNDKVETIEKHLSSSQVGGRKKHKCKKPYLDIECCHSGCAEQKRS